MPSQFEQFHFLKEPLLSVTFPESVNSPTRRVNFPEDAYKALFVRFNTAKFRRFDYEKTKTLKFGVQNYLLLMIW
uniref:Transposase n=1 Tax=Ascaris lumbricoides TaxID=6252 RepID=A0A0M3I648_ASCLU